MKTRFVVTTIKDCPECSGWELINDWIYRGTGEAPPAMYCMECGGTGAIEGERVDLLDALKELGFYPNCEATKQSI
jgi:hypothetical protein